MLCPPAHLRARADALVGPGRELVGDKGCHLPSGHRGSGSGGAAARSGSGLFGRHELDF